MVVSRGLQAPYDGVTEVWWETMSALERVYVRVISFSRGGRSADSTDRGRGAVYRLQSIAYL